MFISIAMWFQCRNTHGGYIERLGIILAPSRLFGVTFIFHHPIFIPIIRKPLFWNSQGMLSDTCTSISVKIMKFKWKEQCSTMWITSKVSVSIRPSLDDGRQVLGNITLTSLILSLRKKEIYFHATIILELVRLGCLPAVCHMSDDATAKRVENSRKYKMVPNRRIIR